MNGKWITCPGISQEKNVYFRARKKINIDSVPQKQLLHIAAESFYRLWVNGHELGRGPARGTRSVNFYDTYEITEYLFPGENVIAVLVQSMNIPNFITFPYRSALMVDLEGMCGSDESWEVSKGDDWKQDVDIFTLQIGYMEHRDMRLTPDQWQSCGDSGQWAAAEEIGPVAAMNDKKLLPRPVPMLCEKRFLPVNIAHTALVEARPDIMDVKVADAVSFQPHSGIDGDLNRQCLPLLGAGNHEVVIEPPTDNQDISIVFDFEREVVGFFELEITAPDGVIIDLAYDEQLEDGRILAHRHHYLLADRYITRNSRQVIGNTIHERGYRMVEVVIRNLKSPLTIHRVEALDRRYPFSNRGRFNCSDSLLNRIWDVCVETMSTCTTDVFNDCPWRERAFWVNDLMIENIVALEAFGDPRVNAHALRLAMSNIREDGMVPGVCPDSDKAGLVLVPTNLFLILMLDDYYMYTGDKKLVEELLPSMLQVLERFKDFTNEQGLLVAPEEYWNFLDWSYELNGFNLNGKNSAPLNWLYVMALNRAAKLTKELSDANMAGQYEAEANAFAENVDRFFWNEAKQRYVEWLEPDGASATISSQLNHAFALLSGSLPEKRTAAAFAALDDPDNLMPELYLHHFVFNAMHKAGMDQPVINRIRKYWGDVILSGSPTLWESGIHKPGKVAFDNAGSLCHGFGCTPINYFQTAILGVRPLTPGFKTFTVDPVALDLDFASGQVPTPFGNIEIKWERNDQDKLALSLKVPHGTGAECGGKTYAPGKHQIIIAVQ